MKKLLALMLAAALALSLVACGGGEDSTQLDAENAIAETPEHIYNDVKENQARAMQNTYLMNCCVDTITDTYFTTNYGIQVHLPIEQLAQLNNGDNIAIIGKITDVATETISPGATRTRITLGTAAIYDGDIPDVEPRED